ncbi:MAG TPA: tripartite tricarboxylate transporter substrate binding protein [Crenalkalicoccus sp.]|nr:tripartite tricarboxylate transporter substrate binding protein [Crenalkalicoccus sp.]
MHRPPRRPLLSRRRALGMGLALGLPALARAESYPARVIRIIVPYPAGGGYDTTARLLADGLSRELGQPVVIENRSGANGTLGMEAAWRAAPDGYTLALSGAAVLTTVPHLRRLAYEPLGFAHIARLVRMPYVIAVRRDLPARTLPEFIALARQNPLTYGATGAGSSQHLAGELFNQTAGTRLTLVPYRGTAPALNDLAAGVVDASVADVSALELIRGGQIRGMAVIFPERWSLLPDVPAVAEVVPDCVAENWYGLAAPPGTPADIVGLLSERIERLFTDPALRRRYDEAGLHPALLSGPPLQAFIRADYDTWGRVVQRGDIKLDAG